MKSIFESLKLCNLEALRLRSFSFSMKGISPPHKIPTPTPAPPPLLGGTSDLGENEWSGALWAWSIFPGSAKQILGENKIIMEET